MATISLCASNILKPSILMDQCSSEPKWREVTVHRKNSKGEIIAYPSGTPIEFHYIEEVATGNLYVHDAINEGTGSSIEDTEKIVRRKCILIAIGAPIYAVGLIFTKLFNIALHVGYISYKALRDFAKEWQEKGAAEATKALVLSFIWEIPKAVFLDIWMIVKTPFFAVAMSAASSVGILNPLLGRKLAGSVEYAWHDFISYKQDFRHRKDPEKDPLVTLDEILAGKTYFLGYCFQKQGNIHEERFIRIEKE